MAPEAKTRLSHRTRFVLGIYALLALPLAFLTVFVYLPFFWGFISSLYEFEIGASARFVGLANYREFLFKDPVTWPSFLNMAFLAGWGVMVRLTVPLLVAKLIHSLSNERSRHMYRILFLVPIVVPGVAIQLIWGIMIFSDGGLVNEFLRVIGLGGFAPNWLTDPHSALIAIACIGFPWVGGFEVLIYYAGLSAIPDSVNEAARLEGCTGIRKFFYIDVPMILGQLRLILILSIIGGVQTFENVLILTRGGPGFATTVPGLWMYYNAFSFQRMGYACGIGVTLFALILSLTALNLRYFKGAESLEG